LADKTAETDRTTVAAELDEKKPSKIDNQAVNMCYFDATYTVRARVDPA